MLDQQTKTPRSIILFVVIIEPHQIGQSRVVLGQAAPVAASVALVTPRACSSDFDGFDQKSELENA